MSTENLKVVATADISGLKTGMNDARKELASTAVAATKLDSSLKGGAKGTNQAANALTNLGRVAQDAPFGFIGIQNNLNPLLESFQRLKAETGSTGSALKSLAGSLIGPAGLGFALSAASALFLAFGPAIKDFINNTTAAEKAQQALNDKLGESEASVAGNLARLSALVAIAKDVSRSDNERKEALGALNKEYDGFNGKLTLANINTAEATRLINAQTAAIVRQAKIKGVENLISEQTAANIKVQNKELSENLSLWDNIKIAIKNQSDLAGGQVDAVLKALKNREKTLKEGEAAITSYSDVLKKLLSEDAIDGTLFKEKNVKPITPKSISVKPKKIKVETDKNTKLEFGFQSLATSEPVEVQIAPKLANKSFAVQQILTEIDKVQKAAAAKLESFRDLFGGIAESIAVSFGDGLASALTGGGIGSFFDSIFKTVGAGLKQLGVYFIIASKLIQKIKASIVKAPQLGLIAGIALVALGGIISAAANKKTGFAEGVRGLGQGGFYDVGERGRERVFLPRGSTVVPAAQTAAMSSRDNLVVDYKVINGKDLAIILKRTNEFNNRNY